MKWPKQLWKKFPPELWVLWAIAIATRMFGLSSPRSTVFDEVYFKQDPAYYFTHHYYFDVHPPLGKLLIAGWAKLIRANPATMTAPGTSDLRVFIAIVGVTIVPLTYGIVRRLSNSRLSAGLAGLMVALDTALIVDSRFVVMDSLLVASGLAAVYAALRFRTQPSWMWTIVTGLLVGAAVSIKWTGLAPGIVALLILVLAARQHHFSLKRIIGKIGVILVLALTVYVSSFAIHFALLNRSGPGDAFMSVRFQSTLRGDAYYNPNVHMSFIAKFLELNHEMYTANRTLTATDTYSSKWYTWPLMKRPVYYWEGPVLSNGKQGNIYFIGNPVSWWLGSMSVVLTSVLLLVPQYRKKLGKITPTLGILLFAYLINFLPFIGIGRVMFLYHYLFAYIFSVMLLACLVGSVLPEDINHHSPRPWVVGALVLPVVICFAYFAPLAYGWPLSPQAQADRIWFSSWR